MLADNPLLAAFHRSRLDHSSAVAHGLLDAAERLAASTLRLQNKILERVAERMHTHDQLPPAMLVAEAVTAPEVQRLGAAVFQEQAHLAAAVGTRWIAYGESHQHGMSQLLGHWLGLTVRPSFAAGTILPQAVESAGRSAVVGDPATVGATEVVGDGAARHADATPIPRGRSRKQQ